MTSTPSVSITAFYKFVSLDGPRALALVGELEIQGKALGILGLILVASEGINATISGEPQAIRSYKAWLRSLSGFADIDFKDSHCQQVPFRRLSVQLREEIVTLKNGIRLPELDRKNRLTPSEWNTFLKERREDLVLIDTRNHYEVEIGRFRGAIDPQIKQFSDFPEYVRKSAIPKDKPVLMYCTGGIRCEKAIIEMQSQGYQEVYQLDGGILKYIEECPEQEFEGECFVFDHRVAVDQHLQPTRTYGLCPHCGNPASEHISCLNCGEMAIVCHKCLQSDVQRSCSKNCAYHIQLKTKRRELQKAS